MKPLMDLVSFESPRIIDKEPDSTIWTLDHEGWHAAKGPRFLVHCTICEGDLDRVLDKLHARAHEIETTPDFHIHLSSRSLLEWGDTKQSIERLDDNRVRFALLWCWSNGKCSPFDGERETTAIPRDELHSLKIALRSYYRSHLATSDEQRLLIWLEDLAHLKERALAAGKPLHPAHRVDAARWLADMKLGREQALLDDVLNVGTPGRSMLQSGLP